MKNKKLFAILTLVCFMFTLMPMAAFAETDVQETYIYTEDKNAEADVEEKVTLVFDELAGETVYVWFEEDANVPTTALMGATNRVIAVAGDAGEVEVAFSRAGEYELHASIKNPAGVEGKDTWAEKVAAVVDYELKTEAGYDVVVVEADSLDSDDYVIEMADGTVLEDGDVYDVYLDDKSANGIEDVDFVVTVWEDKDMLETVYASDVEVDATSGVDVVDVTAKRNGTIEIETVVNKLGTHKVYIVIDDFKATIKISANEGEADSIEAYYVAKTPVNIDDTINTFKGFNTSLVFKIYDEKGNELLGAGNDYGFDKATDADKNYPNYVSIVSQPEDSDLENEDFYLVPTSAAYVADGWTIKTNKTIKEEGTYEFKVSLNDGTSAKASVTIKEAGDPVALNVTYQAESVQLGDTIKQRSVSHLDANYVATSLTVGEDVEIAVSGAAVAKVEKDGTITVKEDEKYVGSEIKVTFIDKENNLVATKVLTVAAEAKELVLDTTAVPVDSTKTITAKLVDENGKSVALAGVTTAEAYVIILDKPVDSDVTAEVASVDAAKGQFKFTFSADTVGVVKVQTVLQTDDNDVVRYYTGVQEIKVGATGIEDVVVMSIGSNQVVVNDEVKLIDAAPIVKDNRTFVPFRALAEAFGAVVAWDEATQSVVAELDGTKVVMTIGSAAYTVNGVEKTADVAPFIDGSRTMVPVRFVAEAFGITVTPTYDDNGATADILFAK